MDPVLLVKPGRQATVSITKVSGLECTTAPVLCRRLVFHERRLLDLLRVIRIPAMFLSIISAGQTESEVPIQLAIEACHSASSGAGNDELRQTATFVRSIHRDQAIHLLVAFTAVLAPLPTDPTAMDFRFVSDPIVVGRTSAIRRSSPRRHMGLLPTQSSTPTA